MYKHIVIWKLKEHAKGVGKEENAQKMKERLEALQDRIPEVRTIEVGLNMSASDTAGDIVLYSEFDSRADFEIYRNHPAHGEAVAFVREIMEQRIVADYEA